MRHEATYNLRQVATLVGTLIAADGRSPLATAMLALDAQLTVFPGAEQVGLGDLLPMRRQRLQGRLITQVEVPLNARLAYEYVARSPADLTIVCAAVAQWPSGRTRVALGGYGRMPALAMDGPEPSGAEQAARRLTARLAIHGRAQNTGRKWQPYLPGEARQVLASVALTGSAG